MLAAALKRIRANRLRRQVRLLMRGYRRLKARDLTRISAAKDALTVAPLAGMAGRSSTLIFGAASSNAELATRQFLLLRAVDVTLNERLLRALGRGAHASAVLPVPRQWRDILRAHGFQTAGIGSALQWQRFVVLMMIRGIAFCTVRFVRGLATVLRSASVSGEPYIYFEGLKKSNLPPPGAHGESYDVMSWYAQWLGRNEAVRHYCHNVPGVSPSVQKGFDVTFRAEAVPALRTASAVTRFAGWSIAATLLAAFDLLRGRWWHAVMLGEAASAAAVRFGGTREGLARDYLFHNSAWIYRSLWTYEAAALGSRILFYFYSSNCEGFKLPRGYPPVFYGYRAMNWPHYLVWDEPHGEFVRRVVADSPIVSVCGPIWFTASDAQLPAGPAAPVIAMFDVAPVRASYYASLALDLEYYVPAVSLRFLDDIHAIAHAAGLNVYWKRKRKLAPTTHPAYRKFADVYSARPGVVSIDPEVSAHRVIEASALVVSMPFTSTALIARELGKPSCYYDPTGQLQPDDRAAHGIPIVQGPAALAAWVQRHSAAPSRRAHLTTH